MADEHALGRLVMSNREPGRVVDVFEPDNYLDVYVDGFVQLSMGPSVSRMTFFKVKRVSDTEAGPKEDRQINLVLTMPTVSLVEWMASTTSSLYPTLDTLQNTLSAMRGIVDGALAAIHTPNEK
jgi:hypothetical protein